MINKIHRIAIFCSDYEVSKRFHTEIPALSILCKTYRNEMDSYKLDFALNGEYIIELFSFPNTPKQTTKTEAAGLGHLAFEFDNIEVISHLENHKIEVEPVRIDEITGKQFTFIADPDNLPIEFYEKQISGKLKIK